MPLIMYIHNSRRHKGGYSVNMNENVKAGCGRPVGNVRKKSREQRVLSVEIGVDRG